jgi:putative transposase
MPWRQTSPLDQKIPCIADSLRQTLSIVEWCELSSVSRKTGDKWIERSLKHGPLGLEERSRQPHSSPRPTPKHGVEALIERRRHPPSWGAKKRLSILQKRHPSWPLPARSTAWEIFSRHGVGPKTRHRRHLGHPGKPTSQILAPNDVWSADFKGHFKTGDGLYCDPLTVADGYSRLLLGCQAPSSTRVQEATPVFSRLFKECGLPKRIRTDNGVPFATNTLARLSPLSAWWVRLGILPEVIEPGKPQQNGRHERMPRTLQAETPPPPAATRRAHQRTFARVRQACNVERPHAALDRQTPDSRYEGSPREMPTKLPPLPYPDRFAGRDVSANGGLRWNRPWVNVSHVCAGEDGGLEEIDDGVWNVDFGPLKLGRLLERHLRIEEAYGRLKRRR